MVINHQRRWVYLAPPKTGSSTLSYLLTDGNDWHTHAQLPESRFYGVKHLGQHSMDIPPECADYLIFASTRNPYSRAVSLWWHWNCESQRLKIPRPLLSFKDFLKRVVESQDEAIPVNQLVEDFFRFTVCRWLKWVPRVDKVIRQEFLEEDLNALELAPPVVPPRMNRARVVRTSDKSIMTRQDWRSYYDSNAIDLVNTWAETDFKRFGYSTSREDLFSLK